MSDDTKSPDAPTAEAMLADAPAASSSPAVHSDELWGGPRFVQNATAEPVWVETKEEYFALLNANSLRMKNQQESSTGPELDPADAPPPPMPAPIVVKRFTQEEAHVLGAWTAILKRYAILESIWCEDCFRRDGNHGTTMRVSVREISLKCRCGTAIYRPPLGTNDVVLNTLANTAVVELDKTVGTIMTAAGPEFRKTIILQDMEAMLIKRYLSVLSARNKEPRLFHRDCYRGRPQDENNAIAMSVNDREVVMVCKCRTLFHRSGNAVKADRSKPSYH